MNMRTYKTHIQKSAATHHLHPGLDVTIDWFNRLLQGKPRYKKAYEKARGKSEHILRMLQRLGPAIPSEQPQKPLSFDERSDLQDRVNAELKRYHYQLFILSGEETPGGWVTTTDYDRTDAGLIAAMLDLGPHLVSRIAFCNCGRAFYRRLQHQQYCSEECRLGFYARSEKWKKYRRDKAREYYWLHKTGIVKANRRQKNPK
jgi:hypothetical protein